MRHILSHRKNCRVLQLWGSIQLEYLEGSIYMRHTVCYSKRDYCLCFHFIGILWGELGPALKLSRPAQLQLSQRIIATLFTVLHPEILNTCIDNIVDNIGIEIEHSVCLTVIDNAGGGGCPCAKRCTVSLLHPWYPWSRDCNQSIFAMNSIPNPTRH